jgi:uncharacterized damage-inducible protein DinB
VSGVEQILFLIDTAYDRTSWHGPNLRGSIRGVSPAQAAWRPARGRHNVWELVVHAAYWKYVARRRLAGATRGSFAPGGSNWLQRPLEVTERAWRADLQVLEEAHRTLREAAASVTPQGLTRRVGKGPTTAQALLTGVAAHDLYHAGQIQLLKRLYEASSV